MNLISEVLLILGDMFSRLVIYVHFLNVAFSKLSYISIFG